METTTNHTNFCDRCGRPISGGWIEVLGMKICGVCQWEQSNPKCICPRCTGIEDRSGEITFNDELGGQTMEQITE